MKQQRTASSRTTGMPLFVGASIAFVLLACVGLVSRDDVATFAFKTLHSPTLASYIGSSDPKINYELGNYFFHGAGYDVRKAQYHFKKTIQLDSKFLGAHYQLGRSYFIVGRFPEAYTHIQLEEFINPELGKVHYMKGLIAGFMKEFELAEEEFKRFIQYDSFNWAGYNDLAWIQFAQGKYHDAEATAREGLAQAAGNPWLQNAIGVNLLAQDRPTEASEYFYLAKEGFSKMTASQWGIAYPGNAPQEHINGLRETLMAIERNIARAQERGKAPIHKQ